LLVDDGLGWASFASKYPRPGTTGLMQTSRRRSTSQGATESGWMMPATTHEGSTSVDVGAIREQLLLGVSHVATRVVPDCRYVAPMHSWALEPSNGESDPRRDARYPR
jgi:hypothetical protein